MARRILFALLILAFPVSLLAQNDFGVWVNSSKYKTTTEADPTLPGATFRFKMNSKVGYGVSFNHFSGPNMSTEFAAHQIRGDATASIDSPNPTLRAMINLGSFRANVFSAVMKWHFMPTSFVTPYIGAGAAYFMNGQLSAPIDPNIASGKTKFQNKATWVADAGVNVNIMRNFAIGLDGRYSPYKAVDKSDPASGSVKFDPLTVALGVRFRM
jgi:outer membrane protein W